ncbi:hypothetical protein PGTUg99_003630 [Puccinia graminis f. sp. tritici]|uniref:Uncharacterized protein n=1 Tax=Puccinia graminis f. sp. tritici TaxID=56615 RepID=A0A5B0NDQ1_PUCGR|nr:hypothetical protein PGTUg99_003630 [Puccinia graminis f. sp. tritici]
MFFQTPSRLLLVVGIALCLYTAESSAESVCHAWWKTLPPGSRTMTVKLMKQTNVRVIKSLDLKAPKEPMEDSATSVKGRTSEGTVLDVCTFDEAGRKLPVEVGCSMMYVSLATFLELGGVQGVDNDQIQIKEWSFVDQPY